MPSPECIKALAFERVLAAAAERAHCPTTALRIMALRPLADKDPIMGRLALIEDIRRFALSGPLIDRASPLGISAFPDIRRELKRVLPEGAILDPGEMLVFMPFLRSLGRTASRAEHFGPYPCLLARAQGLDGFPDVLAALERSLDEAGAILDTASHALGDIRGRRRALDRRIGRRLEEIVRDPDLVRFLQDDFITKRSGRWVIPVRMDSRGQVRGVVHDVSRSGETAFVEPLEIIGLSNELENLVAEEKAEEIHILRSLSAMLRARAAGIGAGFETLIDLDLHQAVALLADALGFHAPEVSEDAGLSLIGARHPVLLLMGQQVVPLDLELGPEGSVMAITGPNAGGKTIALKTVGLLALMALTGLPIPASPSSTIPLFTDVLADIGDEQSIDSSLSTFSAHVQNIASILGRAGRRSLVLIDELGTGTDPAQGAAIGSAVLKDLMDKGALVIATTHLIDVVGFVHGQGGRGGQGGMINASMDFDRSTLTPLYRLRPGEPGQSHALEVAERYGLPAGTLALARQLVGTREQEFHALMEGLRTERQQLERARAEADARTASLREKEAALNARLKGLEEEKKQALRSAYEEAASIVEGIRREAGRALDEARREARPRRALKELSEMKKSMETKLRAASGEPTVSARDLSPGDTVSLRTLGYDATVIETDAEHDRVRVSLGDKELVVGASDLARGATGRTPEKRESQREAEIDRPARAEIKLIGLRVEEALDALEPFLDQAALGHLAEVRIIHGVGTGALRNAVRKHLSGHPLVSAMRQGEPYEGGAGVTIAVLR